MNNTQQKKFIFFSILIAVAVYGIYQYYWNKKIESTGVYSKGVVVNSESTKGGNIITVRYKYRKKQYESRLSSELGKGAIGRQYFIQLDPGNSEAIVFHRDKAVPDCLTTVDAPDEGWNRIPSCP